jgi:hypothetical protein
MLIWYFHIYPEGKVILIIINTENGDASFFFILDGDTSNLKFLWVNFQFQMF